MRRVTFLILFPSWLGHLFSTFSICKVAKCHFLGYFLVALVISCGASFSLILAVQIKIKTLKSVSETRWLIKERLS